jgi:hypothetical protein
MDLDAPMPMILRVSAGTFPPLSPYHRAEVMSRRLLYLLRSATATIIEDADDELNSSAAYRSKVIGCVKTQCNFSDAYVFTLTFQHLYLSRCKGTHRFQYNPSPFALISVDI